jgi:glutathione S-transferase
MLMLERKRLPYERVDFVTLTHPVAVRLHGFGASPERRMVPGNLFGTVPALAAGEERIEGNHDIARFLDERHPERPLFPADPDRRRAVEEAEGWANDRLQLDARRIVLGAGLRDRGAFERLGAGGRMGYLLYRRPRARRLMVPLVARIWAVDEDADRKLLARVPALLDRIDAWMAEGVLGSDEPNAADFMVAPSLALMLYRPDLEPYFEGRPALELVDRFLPQPAGARVS